MCYFKFLLALLNLIDDKEMLGRILELFVKGLFSSIREISEISSRGLKQAIINHADAAKEFISVYFKSAINTFIHRPPDVLVCNSLIITLDIYNVGYKSEILEKCMEILKIRDVKTDETKKHEVLYKCLEIFSLLPPNFPDHVNKEIVETIIYLEIKNVLLANKKTRNLVKDIVEKNLHTLLVALFVRINDFIACRMLRFLFKTSPLAEKYCIDNKALLGEIGFSMIVDESARGRNVATYPYEKLDYVNIFLFLDALEYAFVPPQRHMARLLFREMKNRHRDLDKIREFLRNNVGTLGPENLNLIYEIESSFMFNRREIINKLALDNISNMSRIRILENEKMEMGVMEGDISILEGLIGKNPNDYILKELLVTLFAESRIKSQKNLEYCKALASTPVPLRYWAIFYISQFEPHPKYFEILLNANYEYKDCVRKALKNIIRAFDPSSFETSILNVMRNEMLYKQHLFVIYPLLMSKPELITEKIAIEVGDAVCRLFSTFNPIHQITAMRLFEAVYNKRFEDENVKSVVSIMYTLYFCNCCHAKDGVLLSNISKFNICLDSRFLFFVNENLDFKSLSRCLENELNSLKEKSEGYRDNILNCLLPLIKQCFSDEYISPIFIRYMDLGFLKETLARYFESSLNPKTVFYILKFILESRAESPLNGIILDENILEVVIRILTSVLRNNFLDNESRSEYLTESLRYYFNIMPQISSDNTPLCKFLESLALSEEFLNKGLIIENMHLILDDPQISQNDKTSLISACDAVGEKAGDVHLNFILSFYKESNLKNSELITLLQRNFIRGLRSHDMHIRDDFYILFDESVSRGIYTRVCYLLNFDWGLYEGNWLYCFLRMCLMCFKGFRMDAFRFLIYGDSSFYENVFVEKASVATRSGDRFIPDVNMQEFIDTNIKTFTSSALRFKVTDLVSLINSILFENDALVAEIFPSFFSSLLAKMTDDQLRTISKDFVKLGLKIKDDPLGIIKVFCPVICYQPKEL